MNSNNSPSGFIALQVAPAQCESLAKAGIITPTPIQESAIPLAMAGHDLIGIAQTGTGKTLAFGLPIAARLRDGQTALILAPTRELAQQISETLARLNLRTAIVVGGASMHLQVKQLRSNPQVIIATPGRLMDHLGRGTAHLGRVSIVVLDEADRMLDMGFAPAIKRILDQAPQQRQTMLFSATMPSEIESLANSYLDQPHRIEISAVGSTPDLVDQEVVYLDFEQKADMMETILFEAKESVLVFTRTRHGARKLATAIRNLGHTAAEIHSDRTQRQRIEALNGFKTGRHRILVATDIAARGIDVQNISLVVNYDVPEQAEDYIHRIGRTGRAGASGKALTLALRQQVRDIRDIEKLLGRDLAVSTLSTIDSPILHRPKPFSRSERTSAPRNSNQDRPSRDRSTNGRRPFQREDAVPFRPQNQEVAPRMESDTARQANKPSFDRAKSGDRGRFQKPSKNGPRSFHSRRSDNTQPSWGEQKPAPKHEQRSFSDRISEIPKEAPKREFRGSKPGYKGAAPNGRSIQPHAGRNPAKSNDSSAGSTHPAPSGKSGHRGWSGRPKARRFK